MTDKHQRALHLFERYLVSIEGDLKDAVECQARLHKLGFLVHHTSNEPPVFGVHPLVAAYLEGADYTPDEKTLDLLIMKNREEYHDLEYLFRRVTTPDAIDDRDNPGLSEAEMLPIDWSEWDDLEDDWGARP